MYQRTKRKPPAAAATTIVDTHTHTLHSPHCFCYCCFSVSSFFSHNRNSNHGTMVGRMDGWSGADDDDGNELEKRCVWMCLLVVYTLIHSRRDITAIVNIRANQKKEKTNKNFMHSYVCKQTCSNLQWQTIRRCRTVGTITCHIVVCVCNCFLCVTKWVRERMSVVWVLNKSQLIALYAWMHWLLTLSLYNFVNVWRDSQTNGVNLIESKTLFNTHFKQLCVCALMLLTFFVTWSWKCW